MMGGNCLKNVIITFQLLLCINSCDCISLPWQQLTAVTSTFLMIKKCQYYSDGLFYYLNFTGLVSKVD